MNFETSIFEIVNWFLHVQMMTHKKLQKLLYFSYGIYLAEYNEDINNLENKLFPNNFQAWVHGPVDPNVYEIYKNNGVNYLFVEKPYVNTFNERILSTLNRVMEIYGNYEADELEQISHNQLPWKNARKGLGPTDISTNSISDEDIYITFIKILNGEAR